MVFVDALRVRPEQGRFQLVIGPAFRQRPADACRLGLLQVLVNGAVPDRTRRRSMGSRFEFRHSPGSRP